MDQEKPVLMPSTDQAVIGLTELLTSLMGYCIGQGMIPPKHMRTIIDATCERLDATHPPASSFVAQAFLTPLSEFEARHNDAGGGGEQP